MKKLVTLVMVVILMMSLALAVNAAVGTVVYGYKTDEAPNLDEIDESWGEPVIYVTKDSPNAQIYKFWDEYEDTAGYRHGGTGPNGRTTIQPEASDFWLYVRYDSKNLYIGIKSPDVEFSGSETTHRGDGVHMWLEPMEAVTDPTSPNGAAGELTDDQKTALSTVYSYFWNVAFDDYSVDMLFACLNLNEQPRINWIDDYMHAIIEIPLSNYGLRGVNLHGYEFAVSVRRVSSKSYYDEGYAGWLQWGAGMKNYTPIPNSLNTIVLVDPAQGEIVVEPEVIETEPEVTEPEVTEPEVTEPEVTEPEVTEPEVTEPEVTEPEVTEPEVTEPEVTEPEVTEPEVTEPEVTEPEVTEPEVTEPEVTEPEVTEPEVTEPEVTEPEVTEPEVTEPEVTEPEVTEPEVTEPEVTEPEVTEPEATDVPTTTEPAEKSNTGLIIGIIAAVVVAAAVVVVIFKKKK